MIPKRVSLENFLSFGERQDITFDDGEPLWVVGGPNGVGKSAVFDAITFCLFGAHRGGKGQGMNDLVRHGEAGFFVEFEFEFNGVGYKISRNHKLGGRPTARIEQQSADGTWKAVTGINSATDVKGWSERTLGLPVEAFQASVLLKQGEADKILAAGGAERLGILKKIIAAERYEQLSKRVHDAAAKKASRLDDLRTQRERTPDVTAEQLAEAQLKQDAAGEAREEADAAKAHAAERVAHAKQWAKHAADREALAGKIAAAADRAADADRIQRDHDRLGELGRVLPALDKFVPLRDGLPATEADRAAADRDHAAATTDLDELAKHLEALRLLVSQHRGAAAEHAQEANRTRAEIAGKEKLLTAAEAVATLDAELTRFDPTLDEHAVELQTKHAAATAAERTARDDKTELDTLARQAGEDQKRLADVAAGVPCSRCGQLVTAEHAERERAEVADRLRTLTAKADVVATQLRAAEAAVKVAEKARTALAAMIGKRDQARQRLADRRHDLEALGGTTDAAALRRQLAERTTAAERSEHAGKAERAKQEQYEAELASAEPTREPLDKQVRDLFDRVQKLDKKLAADAASRDTYTATLPAGWHATTAGDLLALGREHRQLAGGGVAERFRLWQQDAALREEWAGQLAEVERRIVAVPEAARVPAAEAERLQKAAADAAKLAAAAFDSARAERDDLVRQAEALAKLKADITTAEGEARVHKRLDELLGKKKLQRELVRTAEAEIVRLANDTVRNLSAGDLSIELDHSEDGDDEAFALKVRRDGSPPIDVAYLSGSQKFRVAVAVALAVGRFAAGQARPLECVIIDEGFGSLDKDGLRATAEELNNLKRHLRRIILVSHQEDFTDHFPVVYRLSKGDRGTVAEKKRRE